MRPPGERRLPGLVLLAVVAALLAALAAAPASAKPAPPKPVTSTSDASAAAQPTPHIWANQAVFSPPSGVLALASGVHTNLPGTDLSLAPGTYALDAVVYGHLQGIGPVWATMRAHIYDATAGARVPNSGMIVAHKVIHYSTGGKSDDAGPGTANVIYQVTRATTIRLRAVFEYVHAGYNAPTIHNVVGNDNASTVLRAIQLS